jgi:probable phosphoglycerate mutase
MQGHMDSPLTELGKQQGTWLSERLKNVPIDHIYSSPSGRAYQTAELINFHKKLEIKTSEKLKEIFLGKWEGLTQAEIEAFDAEQYDYFWHKPEAHVPDGSESFQDMIDRCGEQLEAIASLHEGQSVLIVAHAVVLKSMIAYVEQKEIKDFWQGAFMHSTCLNCFEKEDGKWRVTMVGDTSHYPMAVESKWVNPK